MESEPLKLGLKSAWIGIVKQEQNPLWRNVDSFYKYRHMLE